MWPLNNSSNKNSGDTFPVRVSLLEERLRSYDEITRKMVEKLEQAVDKISESNILMSQIVIRHEETMNGLIEKGELEVKYLNAELKTVKEGLQGNTKAVDDLRRTRWVWVGILTAIGFLFTEVGGFKVIFPQGSPPEPPSVVR